MHAAAQPVRSFLRLLTVNKQIVGVARAVAGRLGLVIQCTVAQVPRAVQVFEHARELRVVQADAALDAVEAARAALERAGPRFGAFVTDPSKVAWLPRLPESTTGYRVVVECSATRRFGGVADGLALAVGMKELSSTSASPTCTRTWRRRPRARGLRVTIQHADFTRPHAAFASAAVTDNLRRLEVVECALLRLDERRPHHHILHALGSAPPLEYLRLEGCCGASGRW